MQKFIITCVVAGLIAGILVSGFHNLFTVSVMERAIMLEEERSAGDPPPTAEELAAETPVSLGVQRIGMAVGTTIYGAILGLVFAGGYALLRRAMPEWHIIALAAVVGALGFLAISLFPFIKYPLNPPGVGDGETLLFRQLMQTLFFILSGAGVAGLLIGIRKIRQSGPAGTHFGTYALAIASYVVFALVIIVAIPGNPDPVPVPIDLLELFRTLTMIGQFLLWALTAAGVALAFLWQARSQQGSAGDRRSVTAGQESGS